MLAAHNSFASLEDGWTIHPMQQYDYTHQFYYGARGFMIDVYEDNGEFVLLHNKNLKNLAGVGASTTKTFYLEDFLRGIKNLLDKHDQTIITLFIENNGVSQKEIKFSIVQAKLENYLLSKNPNDTTLTFGEIRKSNQRLLVFAENGLKTEVGIYSTSYYKETTFSLERDKLCLDRYENRAPFSSPDVKIFVMNHFYTKSCSSAIDSALVNSIVRVAKVTCNDVNDYNNIMARVNLCAKAQNKPTFIAVDFIEQGNYGGALKSVSDLIDESFYQKHLLYSVKRPSHNYKVDLGHIASFAAGVLVGGGAMLAWARYHKPQHMD